MNIIKCEGKWESLTNCDIFLRLIQLVHSKANAPYELLGRRHENGAHGKGLLNYQTNPTNGENPNAHSTPTEITPESTAPTTVCQRLCPLAASRAHTVNGKSAKSGVAITPKI